MKQNSTGTSGRYESPEIEVIALSAALPVCQSGGTDAPNGFNWNEWQD